MFDVLIRRGNSGHSNTERGTPCDKEGRDWSDGCIYQPKNAKDYCQAPEAR